MDNRNTAAGGVGFVGLLQLIFIVLKLCGVINWSWVWVLAPLWIEFVLLVLFFAILCFEAIYSDKRERL